ncbi:hypothetical protein M405DRAFT_859276 [Rhizopogon salebrosus TDB-379]|nr:hypothetical protein M405DRAFT_859276 [Rhizopogon salebrosus TDB-379]
MVDDSVDLTIVTGVRRYLADTNFASDTITVLPGDFANFTYRVHLNDLFEGKETFILKYAPPHFAASGGAIHLATERQKSDVEALPLVLKMHADGDIDYGPGMDTQTLKQLVIDEALPQILAEEIGAAISRFLACMHAWNKEASFDM